MKKLTLFFGLFLLLSFFVAVTSFGQIGQTKPISPYAVKSTSYWTYPTLTLPEADDLAPYGLIIIDMEIWGNNRASLQRIKETNPAAKLICYSNPLEFFSPVGNDRPLQKKWAEIVAKKYPNWLLKTANGAPAIFWPGMVMLNLSASCAQYDTPEYGKVSYGEWMAMKLLTVMEDTLCDGYYMDNGGGNISWVYQDTNTQIDADNNSQPDDAKILDSLWSQGVHSFLQTIRIARGQNFIMLANKGSVEFMDVLDGRFFEGFPCDYLGDKRDGGWHQCMLNGLKTGSLTTFQVADDQDLEFGLASALLIDAYISVGQDNLRYYNQLSKSLGQPKGVAMKQNDIFFREFEKGRVEVWPSLRKGKITTN